jgi:diguanylate cyclase
MIERERKVLDLRKPDPLRRLREVGAPVSERSGGLDLAVAIQILRHAGRPDPTQCGGSFEYQVQEIIDGLCDLSVHDGLTGLVNATFFHHVLSREIERSARTGRTCSLLVIDADHFKQVNDNYGHPVGDLVLQCLAERLLQSLRSMDTAARIGGEEFGVILPECSPEDALHAGARIHGVLNPLIVHAGSITVSVTTSVGLVWTNPNNPVSSTTLVSLADQEMYSAKRMGRARLCHPSLRTTQISAEERSALSSRRLEEGLNDR